MYRSRTWRLTRTHGIKSQNKATSSIMALFGFKSSKEVEEEKRKAAEQAAHQVEQNNMTNLSNLSKGSQLKFAVPYFDVFDPRFMDHGVPVAVHGIIVYSIDDMDLFHQINKNEAYSDETFKNKLRGQIAKYVKGVVANAPADSQIPVLQLERKILEISELIQKHVTPKVEKLFAITIRSLDITSINIDKESRGYRELKAITADLERDREQAKNEVNISNYRQQNEMNMEVNRMQTVDSMRMQIEDQRERLRIQREGIEMNQEQQIKDGRFGRGMGSGMMGGNAMFGTPPMGGMTPPAPPSSQYHIYMNGQQTGPYDVSTLQHFVQMGTMTPQTQVWASGMPQWMTASSIPELASLFGSQTMGMTPPPMNDGNPPAPTL